MTMTGAQVQHIRFGRGIILSQDQNHVRVRFANEEEKLFVYPDAFSSFLRCSDPELVEAVQTDLQLKIQATARQKAEQAVRLREMQDRVAAEKSAARRTHRVSSACTKTAVAKKNP